MKVDLRPGGETADSLQKSTVSPTTQELASAGPSAIESFGPEPNGPVVRVEFVRYDRRPQTFRLRCGLVGAGRRA